MLLDKFQDMLNRNIAGSAAALTLCGRLAGKSLRVKFTHLPLAFTLRSDNEGVRVSTDTDGVTDGVTDATITGTPLGLLGLANSHTPAAMSSSQVHIEGDAEVAQKFSELLKAAKPDLEEELSRLTGDVVAHQIGTTARHVFDFLRRGRDTLLQNTGEYLSEESRDIPSNTEADEFNRDVDTLRDAVERLAARLAILESKRRASNQS